MKTIKVLSIDGGGIRGLIPALILEKIEELMGKPICKIFDVIAGTSTGGILALGLTKPSKADKLIPEFSARDLISLYTGEGEKIFSSSIFHNIHSLGGITEEKYTSQGIEEVLKRYFEECKISECLTDVIIPAYETELRQPFFFKSRHAKNSEKEGYDFYMWQVARATSAAPTYFEPFKLEVNGDVDYYTLIDGGVFANNPAMCAYIEAKATFPDADEIIVVSIGTGELTKALSYSHIKDWGLINWAQPILDVVFDGVSDTVDYQLSQLLSNDKYFRFQASLAQFGKDRIDDASAENIHELKILTAQLIENVERNGYLSTMSNLLK